MDGGGGTYLEHYLQGFAEYLNNAKMIEIAVNPDGTVWTLERGQVHMQPTGKTVPKGTVTQLANQVAGRNSATVGKTNLLVGATVFYQERPIRAQCVLNPAAVGEGAMSMRLFSSLPLDEIKLEYLHGEPVSLASKREARNKVLASMLKTESLQRILEFCVLEKLNIVVSGGTDTGKSVALRKIISMIPHDERLITIEDAPELFPEQPNTVSLIADRNSQTRTTDLLLETTLRMRPDRIIVGEVRGKEAMTFLEAINTGHGGSMTTLHAETPQLALDRLAMAAGRSNVPMTYSDIRSYVLRSIDVIIQAGRTEGQRGIAEIYIPSLEEAT